MALQHHVRTLALQQASRLTVGPCVGRFGAMVGSFSHKTPPGSPWTWISLYQARPAGLAVFCPSHSSRRNCNRGDDRVGRTSANRQARCSAREARLVPESDVQSRIVTLEYRLPSTA